jgi:uncharacterized protein YlxP (DUF503 family)
VNSALQAHIVLISFDIVISNSNSLKTKRAVLNRIKDRVKTRFNASIAEIGHLEKWQRATLAITMVCNEKKKLKTDADKLESTIRSLTDIIVSDYRIEWL